MVNWKWCIQVSERTGYYTTAKHFESISSIITIHSREDGGNYSSPSSPMCGAHIQSIWKCTHIQGKHNKIKTGWWLSVGKADVGSRRFACQHQNSASQVDCLETDVEISNKSHLSARLCFKGRKITNLNMQFLNMVKERMLI